MRHEVIFNSPDINYKVEVQLSTEWHRDDIWWGVKVFCKPFRKRKWILIKEVDYPCHSDIHRHIQIAKNECWLKLRP